MLFHGLESVNEGIGWPNHEAQSPFAPKKPRGLPEKTFGGDWVPTPQSLRRGREYGIAEARFKGAPKLRRRRLGLIQTNRFDESCRSFTPEWPNGIRRRLSPIGGIWNPQTMSDKLV
ncbi:MAG: hypothetical protein WB696_29165, partial [Chthoniobacterales bacterium]